MKKYTAPLKAKSADELRAHATKLHQEVAEMKRGIAMGEVQNYRLYSVKRREAARALTLAQQKDKEK